MKNIFLIASIAARELLHERVFYILLCFGLLTIGMSLVLGQMTYAEQAKLTIDFLLGALHLSMTLFAVFMGISLFQRELNMGSVSMLLAKPISRSSFLLGKFLGQIAVEILVIGCMAAILLLAGIRFGDTFSIQSVLQAIGLISAEIIVMTAITYAFAVNCGNITTASGCGALFLLGHLRESATNFLSEKAEPIGWVFAKNLIPNLEIFNTKNLASYGLLLETHSFFLALLYAVCCAVFFLVIANVTFYSRDIIT